MHKYTRDALDKLEKEEKMKTIRGVAMIVFLLLCASVFMMYIYDPSQPTGMHFNGTITGTYKAETDRKAAPTKVLIQLDEGGTIKVSAMRMGAYKNGKRVIVELWHSKRFKKKSYRFTKYIEPPITHLNESEKNAL